MKWVALVAVAVGAVGCATDRTAGERLDDATVTARVKSQLALDPTAKAYQINVDTVNGVVQLNGFVDDDEGRRAAERVARSVSGVERVENNLSIKGESRTAGAVADDWGVTTRVKAALAADSNTKAHQIKVNVNNGVVQLGGFVDSEDSRNHATRVARSVDGVQSVENNLEVRR